MPPVQERVIRTDIDDLGPTGHGASLRLCIPPDPQFSRYVRERVAGFAASLAVPDADALEFLTAVAEAFANAVEHSRTPQSIEVRCWIAGGDQLLATVVDQGIGFGVPDAAEPRLPDELSERGRGLPIMRRYSDLFDVRSEPGKGTAVTLGRYVARPREMRDGA
jgi:anti-sigma regulatory factor (Ser/Thr protein kinase)